MHTNIMGRTLDEVVGDIESLDLEPIKFKLACQDDGPGWSAQHIERMAQAYRRFLILLARYPGVTIAPTRDIDTVWHTHILDTRKYAADCQRIFGEFLHHYPYLGLRGDQERQQHAANARQGWACLSVTTPSAPALTSFGWRYKAGRRLPG